MRVSGRLFFIILIYCRDSSCGSKQQFGRHLLSLIGFRISDRSALPVRPFVYSPIIIIPTYEQKHNINIQHSEAEESYQENGDVYQQLTTQTDDASVTHTENGMNDPLNDLDQGVNSDIDEIDARETAASMLNKTVTDIPDESTSPETTTQQVTESQTEKTKIPEGPYSTPKYAYYYPTPVYNNELIDNLTLTTSAPLPQIKFALPEDNDNWKMFASIVKENVKSYTADTNEVQPYYKDKWNKLWSSNYPGRFRPIAGLYHDGFLHRPLLNRQGFLPSRQFYE